MLSVKAIGSAQAAEVYFSHDDYYAKGRNMPSGWFGEGAKKLELSGPVEPEVFRSVLEGDLGDGVRIRAGGAGGHRPGMDLTFSAPKSVSLLAFVGENRDVIRAHDEAVFVALKALEARIAEVRVHRGNSHDRRPTQNIVAACFRHASSRELDPQLHTHAVVMNATELEPNKWRALNNEPFFPWAHTGGMIYRSELAKRLLALGYQIDRTDTKGLFEVRGVPAEALPAFSKRRSDIEEVMEADGLSGPKAAEAVAIRTRQPKQSVEKAELRKRWRAEAHEIGLVLPAPEHQHIHEPSAEVAHQAVERARRHLMEHSAVFTDRDLLKQSLAFNVDNSVGITAISGAIDQALERGALIQQKAPAKERGLVVFTTPEAIEQERALLEALERGRDALPPSATKKELKRVDQNLSIRKAARDFQWNDCQQSALTLALRSTDRILGIQGYAGTGKTTALSYVRLGATNSGVAVQGLALTASAAKTLEDDAHIPSKTLASFLDSRNRFQSGPKLWILDEASLVGTHDLLRLFKLAEKHEARVLLVGDKDQLPAIEAGAPFALLQERGMKTESLDEIVRQRSKRLKKAVEHTIDRDHVAALHRLRPTVFEIEKHRHRLRACQEAYVRAIVGRKESALLVTGTNEDRNALNALVREDLESAGYLQGESAECTALERRTQSKQERRDPAAYQVGDLIRFPKARRRQKIEKGEVWKVIERDFGRKLLVLEGPDGRTLEFPLRDGPVVETYRPKRLELMEGDLIRWTKNDYPAERRTGETAKVLEVKDGKAWIKAKGKIQELDLKKAQHLDHGYATTVHAAQGKTCDTVVVHIDTTKTKLTGHESFYVAISRAKDKALIYTDNIERLPKVIQNTMTEKHALEPAHHRMFIAFDR